MSNEHVAFYKRFKIPQYLDLSAKFCWGAKAKARAGADAIKLGGPGAVNNGAAP